MSNIAGALQALISLVTVGAAGNEAEVRKLARQMASWKLAAAVATTTAVAEQVSVRARQKCRLITANLCPAAAVTGAATNYFTLLVDKRTAALPGTPVNLITFDADTATTDDIAAFASKDLMAAAYAVGASAAFDLEEGDVLTVEVTKAGTGMTFPISDIEFALEPRT
jgi:hypothetical protein